ncbi:MAG: phosphodiester glycosidase family protein [Leptolyngbyaceae cyanobacterium]
MVKRIPGIIWGAICVAIAVLGWWVGTRSPLSVRPLLSSSHDMGRIDDTALTDRQTEMEPGLSLTELVTYETLDFPHSLVHVVRISPVAPVTIRPIAVVDGLETVDRLARQAGAIAAINGGFFDPNNQQTTSYVTINGAIALDPEQNQGLMHNLNASPYLFRILNRAEFRRYHCRTVEGPMTRYAIAPHHQLVPVGCELVDALGAGPALLPDFRGEAEAFIDVETNRDAVGAYRPNARSGIGITADGTIVLVMAAQRPLVGEAPGPPTGVSLFDLAQIMADLGIEQGMNLDGGSSSSLYYNGTSHYGRLDSSGNEIRRSVKSILVVVPEAP